MVQTTVFKSNKTQAVRLPKAVALPDKVKQVDVIAIGDSRLIAPSGTLWSAWFDAEGVSEDFIESRDQPSSQEREAF